MFRRICNPAVSNCGFAIRTCPYIYLKAMWFERIANPYSNFRRIANPPKHITDSLTRSRVSYINRQSSTWQSSSLPWGGLGWVSNMPSSALQKAVNRTVKGHVLQAKRRPFGNHLIISGLSGAFSSLGLFGLISPISLTGLIRQGCVTSRKSIPQPPPLGEAGRGLFSFFSHIYFAVPSACTIFAPVKAKRSLNVWRDCSFYT